MTVAHWEAICQLAEGCPPAQLQGGQAANVGAALAICIARGPLHLALSPDLHSMFDGTADISFGLQVSCTVARGWQVVTKCRWKLGSRLAGPASR